MNSIQIKGANRDAKYAETRDGRVKHVEWSPGNGTRYFLTFMTVDQDARFAFEGAPDNFILVLHGTPGMQIHAYPFKISTTQVVAWDYVGEKLALGKVDASEVARVIGTVLDRPVVLCTSDEDGEYIDDRIKHD